MHEWYRQETLNHNKMHCLNFFLSEVTFYIDLFYGQVYSKSLYNILPEASYGLRVLQSHASVCVLSVRVSITSLFAQ